MLSLCLQSALTRIRALRGKAQRPAQGLVAKMTARVVEALPDGTLRIEGTQGLVNMRDEYCISGLVRQEDITADNTVLSTHVSALRYDMKAR